MFCLDLVRHKELLYLFCNNSNDLTNKDFFFILYKISVNNKYYATKGKEN